MVAATSTEGRLRNTIHSLSEVDITEPRRLIREHRERTGETLSLTAYVVRCLARAVAEHPELNCHRKGRRLYILDDVTVNTVMEREIGGERVPEPFPVRAAQRKSYRQIHDEIRAAQQRESTSLGSLSGTGWVVRLLPSVLFRWFVRFAGRSVKMAMRYGVVGVTAVGMFGAAASWAVPLSGATLLVTVGSIVRRPVLLDGQLQEREHLCITVSVNHDLVDGAPAARFLKRFAEILGSGEDVRETTSAP